jgi:hypothetical protein
MLADLVKIIHEYCGFDIEYAQGIFESEQHEKHVFSDIISLISLTNVFLISSINASIDDIFKTKKTVLSGEKSYKYFTKFIEYTGITVTVTKFTKFVNLFICKKCYAGKLHTKHIHADEAVKVPYYNITLNTQPTIKDLYTAF